MLRKIAILGLAAATVAVTSPAAAEAQMNQKDLVTVAVEAGSFTTLATALERAGLVATLQGEGPFTVFAPTDEAFAALPEGALEELLADREALTRVLTYHVVAGEVTSDQVVTLDAAETVAGPSLSIEVRDGVVYVDGARVVTADVQASNGVIHVVDSVLLPGN